MLSKLINPDSIAIIGASTNPEKVGYQIVSNIVKGGYNGKIYPINLHDEQILNLPAYKNIKDISGNIDLAVIVIPSVYVLAEVKTCIEKNVKALIIISAGFAETGQEGVALQNTIAEICQKHNVLLLGPNCLGLINTEKKLNVSFSNGMPQGGNISLLSQSGAIISSMIDWSKSASVGFNMILSLGNKALLSEADALEYLYQDNETKVIIGYIEELRVTDRLTEILIKYAKTKPTIILFGGQSEFGSTAAASHTGSIVSSYLSVKTYLNQAGVITPENMESLLLLARFFSSYHSIKSDSLAIITNAGGPAIAASDSISKFAIKLAKLEHETMSRLSAFLPKESNIKNPVDILGDANEKTYLETLKIVEKDENVDAIIVLLTPQSSTKIDETARVIADFHSIKPVVSVFIGGQTLDEAKKIIESSGKSCFAFPEQAVMGLRALVDFSNKEATILKSIVSERTFDENSKMKLLRDFGLPVLEYNLCEDLDSATKYAHLVEYPVVIKTANKDIVHKSDADGVKLDIKSDLELKSAYEHLSKPVIVGKMVKSKVEIFLGVKKDPRIGTIIAFGTGGIFAEIYKDFSYRVSPLNSAIAKEMINETKIGTILSGARNQAVYDLETLANIMVKAAKFADSFENITEIDFNPILSDGKEFYIVDARIITK